VEPPAGYEKWARGFDMAIESDWPTGVLHNPREVMIDPPEDYATRGRL